MEDTRVVDEKSDINTISDIETARVEILKHVKPRVIYKLQLPAPTFKADVTRTIWTNADDFINKFDLDKNPELVPEITDKIRWLSFGDTILDYFNFEYGTEQNSGTCISTLSGKSIILHIKRATKNKPQMVISKFINTYYKCPHCNSLTCRIGKINSQMVSVCVLCNYRNLINDTWTK
jgi:translation initiation factor 2 beta subunit (eIF-2beta)/eIF-5